MKSYKQILEERINIRCAMWTAGLLTDDEFAYKVQNCNAMALAMEKSFRNQYVFHPIHRTVLITEGLIKSWMPMLDKSNKNLIKKFLT